MNTKETENITEKMRELGRIKTEKKAHFARLNGKKGGRYQETERTRLNRIAAQQRRREREAAEKREVAEC